MSIVHCPHAALCPGCPAIQLPLPQQLERKELRLRAALDRVRAPIPLKTAPIVPPPTVERYRSRAKLIVGKDGEIGLYTASTDGGGGTHQVVDIPGCRVLSETILAVVAQLRVLIQECPALRPQGATAIAWNGPATPDVGALRALDLREVQTDRGPRVLVTWVMHRDRVPDRPSLLQAAQALSERSPSVLGVALNLHDGASPQILGPRTEVLTGPAEAREKIGEYQLLATHGSFVQAHPAQAEAIRERILAAVAPMKAPRILELFGGSGLLAMQLARRGADVTLVEAFAPAADRVARAAEQAHIGGIHVRAGDAEPIAQELLDAGSKFDVVIANPPRRGLSPRVRSAIAQINPSLLVYVSCDPDTLARDLLHFQHLGFQVGPLAPFDMIPLTDEVETLAILRPPRPGPPPAMAKVLYEDDQAWVIEKPAHIPLVDHREGGKEERAAGATFPFVPQLTPNQHIFAHRLERGESGAVWICKQVETPGKLRSRFTVLVKGAMPARGRIGLPDETARFTRLETVAGHSLIQLSTESRDADLTVRKRLAAMGHPVLGDRRFGHPASNVHFEQKYGLDRPFFHVSGFLWQKASGGAQRVWCPLAGDLVSVLSKAGATTGLTA